MAAVATEKLTPTFNEVIAQLLIQTATGEECIGIFNSPLKARLCKYQFKTQA